MIQFYYYPTFQHEDGISGTCDVGITDGKLLITETPNKTNHCITTIHNTCAMGRITFVLFCVLSETALQHSHHQTSPEMSIFCVDTTTSIPIPNFYITDITQQTKKDLNKQSNNNPIIQFYYQFS